MLAVAAVVQGCAPLVVAGAGTAAVAAHDRRTVGAFIDDQAIELKAATAIRTDETLAPEVHINVTSMNGIVLLTGEAPTAELRDRVLAKVREIDGIRRVVNEIRIAPPSPLSARTHDGWITAKVKTRLMHTEKIDSTRVKVVTENDVVYLMGLVTRAEGETASAAAAKVGGVARVVKLFEYLD
ncbi:MAG TPA: BON domain-containing protein [Burkholderiales bacterium]